MEPSRKEKTPKFKQYRREIDMRDPHFRLGIDFPSMKELREAVREYAVMVAMPVYFKKNDRDKVTIRCKGLCNGVDCKFLMYASFVKKGPTVRIKNLQPAHLCGIEDVIKFATSSWLADRYEHEHKPQNDTSRLHYYGGK